MVEIAEGPHLEKDDVASESTPEFEILLPHLSKVLGGLVLPLDLPVVSVEA